MILSTQTLNEKYLLVGEVYVESEDLHGAGFETDKKLISVLFIPNKDYENDRDSITSTIVQIRVQGVHGKEVSKMLSGFDIKGYSEKYSYLAYDSQKLYPDYYNNLVKDIVGCLSQNLKE